MSQNPLNLALRFILEMAALVGLGYWGWRLSDGLLRFLFAIGIPLVAAILWGTFRVPGDASSSGKAPVPVPGWVRLILELGFFALSVFGLVRSGQVQTATYMGFAVVFHYLISYDRILWLLRQ